MLNFLLENGGTLLVGAIVIALLVAVLVKLRRDRKKGVSSCGCGCGCDNCPSSGMCHKK